MYDELILKLREDAEFLKISSKYNNIKNEFAERISQAADVIEKLSKERKKGMWLYWWDEPDYDTYECTCGTSFNIPDGNPLEHNYNFCPNCGADMRGET